MGRDETKIQEQIQNYLKSIGAYRFKVHGDIFMRARYTRYYLLYKW